MIEASSLLLSKTGDVLQNQASEITKNQVLNQEQSFRLGEINIRNSLAKEMNSRVSPGHELRQFLDENLGPEDDANQSHS